MNELLTTLTILAIIVAVLAIIALLYIIIASRRRAVTLKKVDYLVEDITYKAEMLNGTVETVAKVSSYVDIFEVFTRKNMKSATKVISRNKDDIYIIANRIKNALMGSEAKKSDAKAKGDRDA